VRLFDDYLEIERAGDFSQMPEDPFVIDLSSAVEAASVPVGDSYSSRPLAAPPR
jgi:hypothetical protein